MRQSRSTTVPLLADARNNFLHIDGKVGERVKEERIVSSAARGAELPHGERVDRHTRLIGQFLESLHNVVRNIAEINCAHVA